LHFFNSLLTSNIPASFLRAFPGNCIVLAKIMTANFGGHYRPIELPIACEKTEATCATAVATT
jgi:hypothetical protein